MKQSHYSDCEALNSHTTVTAIRLFVIEANLRLVKQGTVATAATLQ